MLFSSMMYQLITVIPETLALMEILRCFGFNANLFLVVWWKWNNWCFHMADDKGPDEKVICVQFQIQSGIIKWFIRYESTFA
jgi:hypothetical protein